jgi:hypothetical protein
VVLKEAAWVSVRLMIVLAMSPLTAAVDMLCICAVLSAARSCVSIALICEELRAATCVVLSACTSVVDSCWMAVVLREAICRTVREETIDMKRLPCRSARLPP